MKYLPVALCAVMVFCSCSEEGNDPVDADTTVADADTAVIDEALPDEMAPDEDDLLPDDACVNLPVEDAFLEQIEGYDAYLAFSAVGMINEADVTTPVKLFQSKFVALLTAHADITLDQAVGFILEGEREGSAVLEMTVLADPGTKIYGSLTVVVLSKEWLISHKDALLIDPVVEEAPLVQVMSVEAASQTVVKKCIVAMSALDPEHPDLPAPGRTQVSVCDNVDFSAEENLRIGINAELTEDVATILSLLGLEDEADLCSCADAATNEPVDCP